MGRPRTARAAQAKPVAGASKKPSKAATAQCSTTGPPAAAADLTMLLSTLTPLLSSATAFLSPSPALRASLVTQLQSLYAAQLSTSSALRLLPPSALLSILPSLLTDGFSVDQIYEQWQMLQRPLTQRMQHTVSDIVQQSAAIAEEQKGEAVDEDGEEELDEDEDDLNGVEDYVAKDEELDDEDAEMEARLDAQQNGDEEADNQEGEGEDDAEGEEDDAEEDDEEQEEQKQTKHSKQPTTNKRTKRTTATASSSTPRAVSEDAFFSLDQMERFADHYEDIDNQHDDDERKQKPHSADGEDEEAEDGEWDDEVDLDADVGDVDVDAGERYDDFFDPPTEEELRGQSITDMHRQEDDEEEEGGGAGRRQADEDEDEEGAEEGEEDEMELDEDDDAGAAAVEGDEFGGYFARVASHRRAQAKKDAPALPPATELPEADTTSAAATAPLSHFAQQQQALSSTLQQLEQQLITPKPWFHRGEVSATDRPSDSLLTTDLQVESNVKQREVMTRAVNESIEEIIRRRVSEGRYDDPVKRTVAKAKPYKVKESTEVSSEKSTLGLAELYEQQYMEQKARDDAALNGAADGTGAAKQHKSKQQQERDKQVSEIRTLFASLVADLSALSQYSYVPAERSDVRIVRDKNEGDVLAAEEVGIDFESGVREGRSVTEVMRGKRSGEMVGEGEKEQVERKRRRRQMKERGKKRKRDQAVEDRDKQLSAGVNRVGARKVLSQDELKKALGAANVKKGTVSGGAGGGKGGSMNKSGQFFSQLQQNVAAVEADARREGMLK